MEVMMTNLWPELKPMARRRFMSLSLQGAVALAVSPAMVKNLLAGEARASLEVSPRLLQKTIASALKRGGELAEVYVVNRISRSIILEEGQFKSAVFG
jgi:hypothetical protein